MADGKIVRTNDSKGNQEEYRIYEDGDVYKVVNKGWLGFDDTITKVGTASSLQNGIELAQADSGGKVDKIKDL